MILNMPASILGDAGMINKAAKKGNSGDSGKCRR